MFVYEAINTYRFFVSLLDVRGHGLDNSYIIEPSMF